MENYIDKIAVLLHYLFEQRKIAIICFFIVVAITIILLVKFIHIAKNKKVNRIDFLYMVKDKDGNFSPTRALSFLAMGMIGYIDIKFIDNQNAVNALWVHVFLIGLLQGLIKAVDIVAIKNGGYSKTIISEKKTETTTATGETNPNL